MRKTLHSLSTLALVLSTATLSTASITYTTVTNPGSQSVPSVTQLYGVNNAGTITGIYQTGAGVLSDNAFTYNGTSFTPINCPTATCGASTSASEAPGINNNGVTIGTYFISTNNSFGGYTDNNGVFSNFLVTAADCATCSGATAPTAGANKGTLGQGINASGAEVGNYSVSVGTIGFYSANGTSFQPILPSGVNFDAVQAINNNGEIGGNLCPGSGASFTCAVNSGKFGFTENVSSLGTVTCYSAGVAGSISGCTSWVTFGIAGATNTTIQGIDSNGDIVGFFTVSGLTEGYIYNPTTTTETTVVGSVIASGAFNVQIFGINPNGNEFVGSYVDSNGNTDGFYAMIGGVSTTPEPGTWLLSLSALSLLVFWGHKRRRA